jgi:hypothetical protein
MGIKTRFKLGIYSAIIAFLSAAGAAAEEAKPWFQGRKTPPLGSDTAIFDEGSIIDQAIMEGQASKIYDWRNSAWQWEVGLDEINERNLFHASGWHVGTGFSLGGGWMLRSGIRRIEVSASPAAKMLEKTPFRQFAQPSRWEIFGSGSYSLLEGRTSSRLSQWISDTESVLSVEGGIHYVFPSRKWPPKSKQESKRLEGQSVGYSLLVLDLGLRYQFFVPAGVGFFLEGLIQVPMKKIDPSLGMWNSFSFGMVYSLGDRRR